MKKMVFFSLLTFLAVYTYAQDIDQKNVPAVIVNAFQLEYANADDVDWELREGNYRVEFELNKKDHRVLLDNKGNILKHRQELWESEIPLALIETVRSKCKYFDLDNAVVNEEGGKAVYYISFEVNNRDCKFWMDERGRLLLYRQELKESDIPASIQASIRDQYASFDFDDGELSEEAGKVTYYMDGEVDDKDHSFWFDGKGKLLKHSQDLRDKDIPLPVITAISSLYPGYEIRDADKIEEGGKIIYDMELRKSKERINVKFDPAGKVLEIS
jgi:uncharacterized membrane protein YkoI